MPGENERLSPSSSKMSLAVKIRLSTLGFGFLGTVLVGWSMSHTRESAKAAGALGLQRVQSHMDDILGILALPMLMFFVILALWSLVDLARLYRIANDPERFRGKRQRR